MGIVSKTSVAAKFETNDKPTQQDFADLIDSAVMLPGGATPQGFVEVISTSESTVHASAGTFAVAIPVSGSVPITLGERFNRVFNIEDLGATGDAKHRADGRMATGSADLLVSAAPFVSADVGKRITVSGAGVSGHGLIGSISAFLSAGAVTLDVTAGASGNAYRFDYGTNDTVPIQNVYAAAALASGAVVEWNARGYVMTSAVIYPDKVATRGAGMGASTIYQMGSARVFTNTAARTWGSIEDLTIKGMWHILQNLGGNEERQIAMQNFERLTIRRIESLNSRQMGITGDASEFLEFNDNIIRYCARDALNPSGSKGAISIRGNLIQHCGDDCIAAHISKAQGNPPQRPVIVSDNIFEDSFGIKVLGMSQGIIANNVGVRMKGYGARIGVDSEEGLNDPTDILIEGNNFTDLINATAAGGGAVGAFFFLNSPSPSTAGVVSVPPGQLDTSTGTWTLPETFLLSSNATGAASPHGGGRGVVVRNNNASQMLPSVTAYSQWGLGQSESNSRMFTNAGWADPSQLNRNRSQLGVQIGGAAQNYSIKGNAITNTQSPINFFSVDRIKNVRIENNDFVRFVTYGVSQDEVNRDEAVDIFIRGNYCEADPFHEHDSRNSAANDGTWASQGDNQPALVDAVNWEGVHITDNIIKNTYGTYHSNAKTKVINRNNTIIGEFGATAGAHMGVRNLQDEAAQHYVWERSNPTTANYGQGVPGGAVAAAGQPTTGAYMRGHVVRNNGPIQDANEHILYGWMKTTAGEVNTSATWADLYFKTSSA